MRYGILRNLLVVSINMLVLSLLLLVSELAARIFTVEQSCVSTKCDWRPLTTLQIADIRFELSHKIGLTKPDPILGWTQTPGFDGIIDDPGWRRSRLSITSRGFRSNGAGARTNGDTPAPDGILVVGDSYAFGAQVSDWETWASCLERQSGIPVYNAGVSGYGAAQSVRRAQMLTEDQRYGEVIWEILVGHDFERDRLNYKSGFAKPSVIRESGEVKWSGVSDPMRKGTKYNPDPPSRPVSFAYENSMLVKDLIDTVLHWDMAGMNLTTLHPDAATKREIIDMAFADFARTNPSKKSILLQYKVYGWLLKDVLDERRQILETADRYGIEVIDSMDAVSSYEPAAVWDGHHTAFGNQLVCDTLMAARNSESSPRAEPRSASLKSHGS